MQLALVVAAPAVAAATVTAAAPAAPALSTTQKETPFPKAPASPGADNDLGPGGSLCLPRRSVFSLGPSDPFPALLCGGVSESVRNPSPRPPPRSGEGDRRSAPPLRF